MVKKLFALLLIFAFAPLAFAQTYKVESIGALTETKVPDAARKLLEDKALRVTDEKGKTLCELWLRKDVPTGKDEVAGASFGQIPEGTFLGIINFPSPVSDFRGQGIKAGWYSLRYGLILQDGNHLGVSTGRDFALLLPAAEDKTPEAQMKVDEILKLSRVASGTGHPSPWFLLPATSADKELPKIIKNEHEHVILETKLMTKSGAVSIGMIVVGKTEG